MTRSAATPPDPASGMNGRADYGRDWPRALLDRAAAIDMIVFDIDGVMTDGRLYRDDNGLEIKAFHSRDGLGVKALMAHGVAVGAVTARESRLVRVRMEELGVTALVQGCQSKGEAFEQLVRDLDIGPDRAAFMGDDLLDWPAMRRAGLKLCPADADPWIGAHCDYVATVAGGRGAVREVCELMLAARGRLDQWRASFQ